MTPKKSGIRWASAVDVSTLNDAFCSWDKGFRREGPHRNPKATFLTFYRRVLEAEYIDRPAAGLRALKLDNISPGRFASTPEAAFPEGDRPRGQDDIDSVRFYMGDDAVASPLLVAKTAAGLLMLDGVHRAAAAHIRGGAVRLCIVDLRLRPK
jgi:hypothetical protein